MTLIQYVIVRADLMKVLKWNIGAVITQACHAVAAVNEVTKSDELTRQYLSPENLDQMHKCVLAVMFRIFLESLQSNHFIHIIVGSGSGNNRELAQDFRSKRNPAHILDGTA